MSALTPALSHMGERGKDNVLLGVRSPLPLGEGQGEGHRARIVA